MDFKFKYIVEGFLEEFEFNNGKPFYALIKYEYFNSLNDKA